VDFYKIKERPAKNGVTEVYPDFKVTRSKDLMIQGKQFYAVWDEERQLWSTDEYDVQRLVDEDLMRYKNELAQRVEGRIEPKLMGDFSSNTWLQFRNYVQHLSNSYHQLDENLTFANTEVKRTDYVSKRLGYALAAGDISAYDELIGTLYDPEERAKLEWAIGAIVSGDSKNIHKFIVLEGPAGTGKSTLLDIVLGLFDGYYTTFEAKALTGNNNAFATEVFRNNPLVAVQHDGDLSKIEDNTKLNSIVAHEPMQMNEKYKSSYTFKINAFLWMGTNKPVRITDAKSGLIRRMIDVHPSGRKLAPKRYQALMSQIRFEYGAIAWHCLETYRSMGKDYYAQYRPIEMMLQTDVFFNFIEAYFDVFKAEEGITLAQAYEMYKRFSDESNNDWVLPRHKFREEFKNYFSEFEERAAVDGIRVRSWYSGFKKDIFTPHVKTDDRVFPLVLDSVDSLFDRMCADQPAQYAREDSGTPQMFWDDKPRMLFNPETGKRELMTPPDEMVVSTVLGELDTTQLHYVKPGSNHIVIDFDLKDDNGEKSLEKNLEAASKWPATYAELSQGGAGIHLHYIWDGDVSQLSNIYAEGIEIKVFNGNSSLRRRLSSCNTVPVATLSSGLPLKEKKVITADSVKSEKALRDLVERNLRKEIHASTKPSIDFIHKILEDAHDSGLQYDLTDMKSAVLSFAFSSSNQALQAARVVKDMKFASEEHDPEAGLDKVEKPIAFFDVEIFPNLFILCWVEDREGAIPVRMINPSPEEVESVIFRFRLIGFYNRRYDNHMLYARGVLAYNNTQLYNLSQKLIGNVAGAGFREAYELSYADVYDYASEKMSLKKWELTLGIPHKELNIPWDQPIPEERWEEAAEYCDNDVLATKAVHHSRSADFVARQILAELSGLSINTTTQNHAARIIFGKERNPQKEFVYTDLSEMFPGYEFDMGKSTYKGEEVGEGGLVRERPGLYEDVAVYDVLSMHPSSIIALNYFGRYTPRFKELLDARVAIKHGDYDAASKMLDGRLAPYLGNKEDSKKLAFALKIVINIVYGLTAARFENPFKDPRNKDNIVAKRGALFMIDLQNALREQGVEVIHIKTDSVKIANPTQEIQDFIFEFGSEYGYTFEYNPEEGDHYQKFALINGADYIALKDDGTWEAVGARFSHPYVFKALFSKEPIVFDDYKEIKTVSTSLWLDFEGDEMNDTPMALDTPSMRFVGKAGAFVPVLKDGGFLMREKEGSFHAANGTSGYRWLEADQIQVLGLEDQIDLTYYYDLVDKARAELEKLGDAEQFLN